MCYQHKPILITVFGYAMGIEKMSTINLSCNVVKLSYKLNFMLCVIYDIVTHVAENGF